MPKITRKRKKERKKERKQKTELLARERKKSGEGKWPHLDQLDGSTRGKPLGRRKLAPRSRATVVKAAGSWALTESRRGSQREVGREKATSGTGKGE